MISIIIPAYNRADDLDSCLRSITAQDYDKYEIIVVNDGSNDNTEEVVKKHKEELGYRLDYIEQENQGSNPARNRGFEKAKGELLIFCDADVVMRPDCLKLMRQALLDHPEASYAYSGHKFGWKKFPGFPFDEEKLKQMPYIHTTSLIRREHFPGFDENIKRLQDWDLWLTMLEWGHQGVWIDQILFTVRSGGTMSSWLPSFAYKLPFLPAVKKYRKAEKVIKEKHNLD